MSEVKIKELDKSLIHRANSNSMSGKRGDISAHEYEVYCQKVMSWNIPDSRKQKIVDQIYAKWSEQLNGKGSCLWASEIEPFPIAVTKYHFGEE